jgi:hypothetical protein
MHLFIPYLDADRTEQALQEAGRIARPGDRVTVMAPVIVPAALPLDVGAGEIWARVCQAERRIAHSRESARRILLHGVHLHCLRVQARDEQTAILAGLATVHADCLLLAVPPGVRGTVAMHFGTIPAVIRNAPCSVRLVGAATPSASRSPLFASDTTSLGALQALAVNPALAGSVAKDRAKAEGQHAS